MLREDGIVETRAREDWSGREDVHHAKENMKAVIEISGGQLRPTLNFLPDHSVSNAAQEYYKNHPVAAVAAALVTTSAVQRILGNFLMKFINRKLPTRMFDDERSAVGWLREEWGKKQAKHQVAAA